MNEQESKLEKIINDDIELDKDISADNETIPSEISIVDDYDNILALPAGEALDIKETYNITAKDEIKMVVLVGPSSSGKTTIIASIYQLFLRSPLNEYYFAGSTTLLGYEQRSYYSRFSTNQDEPMTGRTSRGTSNLFLHMRLWNSEQNKYVSFLFADVSGEDYEQCINNSDAVKGNLGFIKYADYIVSVLDGELISDKYSRNGLTNDMSQLLQTIIDSNLISENTKLQVLFSKYDWIDQPSNSAAGEYIEYCKGVYTERFESQFSDIKFYNVAAMPKNGDKYGFATGIKELIISWLDQDSVCTDIGFASVKVNNEFNKLYNKLVGE